MIKSPARGGPIDQLVFVHGVNTRRGNKYDLEVENRDALFKKAAWAGSCLNIRNSYWGEYAAHFTHNLSCLPSKGSKSAAFGLLGGGTSPPGAVPGELARSQPISALAAFDFGAAVDAIFVTMIEETETAGKTLTVDQVAKFCAAGEYAVNNAVTPPPWAIGASSDQIVIAELRKRVSPKGPATFGLAGDIAGAAKALADRARNLMSKGIAPMIRDGASPLVIASDLFRRQRHSVGWGSIKDGSTHAPTQESLYRL